MTPSTASPTLSVSGARKAAMFVMGIGGPLGAELLRQLEPEEIKRISTEISVLHSVAPENMVNVFREFETMTGSSRFFAKAVPIAPPSGRAGPRPGIRAETPGRPAERRKTGRRTGNPATDRPQQLAALLRDENPQPSPWYFPICPPSRQVHSCRCSLSKCSRR